MPILIVIISMPFFVAQKVKQIGYETIPNYLTIKNSSIFGDGTSSSSLRIGGWLVGLAAQYGIHVRLGWFWFWFWIYPDFSAAASTQDNSEIFGIASLAKESFSKLEFEILVWICREWKKWK